MRRMNYNPFEKPFASGEYDINNQRFLLDKPIDANHVYYAVIYSDGRISSFGPAFVDFRFKKIGQKYAITSIPLIDNSDDTYIFGLRFAENDKNVDVIHPAVTPSTSDEGFVIYIYQLM